MPAGGLVFALLLVVTVAGTLALWAAIDRETDDNPTMSRADAERAARKDTEEERDSDDENRDDWGTDSAWGVDDERR